MVSTPESLRHAYTNLDVGVLEREKERTSERIYELIIKLGVLTEMIGEKNADQHSVEPSIQRLES